MTSSGGTAGNSSAAASSAATGSAATAALRGLTTRGRAFLLVGALAVVVAVLFGQRDLLRLGVLLLALPLACAWAVSRTRYRLSCFRRLEPPRVPAGSTVQVAVTLDNVSRLPSGLLLIEDQVPYALGARPRVVLDRLESRGGTPGRPPASTPASPPVPSGATALGASTQGASS